MSKYNKAIAACAAALIEIINLVLPQTQGQLRSVLGILIVLLGSIAVYAVPNRPSVAAGASAGGPAR